MTIRHEVTTTHSVMNAVESVMMIYGVIGVSNMILLRIYFYVSGRACVSMVAFGVLL
jgi:hypothetical protein